jgi:hypothetical protein
VETDARTRVESLLRRASAAVSLQGGSLLDWCFERRELDADARWKPIVERNAVWCEFGVHQGRSLRLIASHRGPETELWGFDSFRGLPEPWNAAHPAGRFALEAIPVPPPGVCLAVGLFAATLPAWAPPREVSFAYIDCDLYASARSVLALLASVAGGGAIVVLDDFFTPPHDRGVARALAEWRGRPFDFIARRGGGRENESVAIRLGGESVYP